MQVNLQYAQEHLDELLDTATRGDEVEITRPDQSSFRLTLVRSTTAKQTGTRTLGAGVGELRVPSWEEWQAMDKEIARAMNERPLFPEEFK